MWSEEFVWETFYGAKILFKERQNITFLQRVQYKDDAGRFIHTISEGDRRILEAARVSFLAENEGISDDFKRDFKLVKYLLTNKHSSPFQHVMYTFTLDIPVFVKSQAERHRTFDFTYWQINEESRRYTSDDVTLARHDILWRKQSDSAKQGSAGGLPMTVSYEVERRVGEAYKVILDTYAWMIEQGAAKEQARQILPQSMLCTMLCTVDLWNLLNFLMLRCDPHAQVEIRVLAYIIKNKMLPMMNPWVSQLFNEWIAEKGWVQEYE